MGMSAEAMNEIFRKSVNLAQECAEKTKDEGLKGQIYATLALAMANTGVINVELSEAADLTPKAEATREDLQPKAAKKFTKKSAHKGSEDMTPSEVEAAAPAEPEAQVEEVKKPAEAPQAKSEEKTFGAEWTDAAVEYFAKETEFIQEHQGKLYEMYYAAAKEEGQSDDDADVTGQQQTIEFFNAEVEKATAGTCHTQEDINPMNIKYIVEFLKAVERGEEPEEGAYLPA